MADVLRLPYGLMGSYSLFGSDTFLFRKCFKIALFYIIIMVRPISEFGVQPAIELNFDTHISFHSVSSIFWQLSDKTRHFVSVILSLLYLCLQTCYLWASACILVCDLTSSERQNNWISILISNFIQFHRYFDNWQIKLDVSIILSLLIYLCMQTCYLWASACILVCDLTSSERPNIWVSILVSNFIQVLRYFRICQIKLGNIFSIKFSPWNGFLSTMGDI